MREIKFRAKTAYETPALLKGAWVYGSYVYNLPKNSHKIINPEGVSFEVDPETVGQFMGFMDSRGIEIYEGDALEFRDSDGRRKVYYEVAEIKRETCDCGLDKFLGVYTYLEDGMIIGNIYENPELLIFEK